jgi:hypothetical protein
MPALVAGIQLLNACSFQNTWMAGTSPAMTATMFAADVCELTVGRYFCKFREAGIPRGDNGGFPEVKSGCRRRCKTMRFRPKNSALPKPGAEPATVAVPKASPPSRVQVVGR